MTQLDNTPKSFEEWRVATAGGEEPALENAWNAALKAAQYWYNATRGLPDADLVFVCELELMES